MQRDDRGRPGLRQRQQALRQRHQGPVPAMQERGDDIGEQEFETVLRAVYSSLRLTSQQMTAHLSLRGHSCDSPHE